ncbi:hypothetical protein BTIS_0071 [Bifidobacterium tissieri]|uniref:Uncharacterized protein n=1 Tax=Bifidobacterium tissieri TaxID=1630162 RepID=A0A261FJJ2_9BIFI|nr:hypothetical protein [Bifidobacterium tissieri]OZG59340.1 hypothetical protein BTIS_0071 [Bifidobacterium tissieri]
MPIMLIFDLVLIVIMLAVGALMIVVTFAIGLVTHPIRTLLATFNILSGVVGGLALLLAVFTWFCYRHDAFDFNQVFWGFTATTVISIIIRILTTWALNRIARHDREAQLIAQPPRPVNRITEVHYHITLPDGRKTERVERKLVNANVTDEQPRRYVTSEQPRR